MAEQIKPCPICGGTNVKLGNSKTNIFAHWVSCYGHTEDGRVCTATGPVKATTSGAIKAWNNGELV